MCAQHVFAPVRRNVTATPQNTHKFSKVSVLDGFGLYVPAMQVSAARIGLAASPKDAARNKIIDQLCRVNFARLSGLVFGEAPVIAEAEDRAGAIVSSYREDGAFPDALYEAARRAGWTKQIVVPRKQGCGEKGVDTAVAIELVKATILRGLDPARTEVTLIGCDKDHLPAIELLKERGYAVDILGWRHATSCAMIEAASGRFVALDDFFDLITFRKMVH